jgi:hypothetical protein
MKLLYKPFEIIIGIPPGNPVRPSFNFASEGRTAGASRTLSGRQVG